MEAFFINVVIPGVVGGGAAWVAVSFLLKKLIDQQLFKELETHKNELNSKTEDLKTKLSIFAHEQNVVTSRVDNQIASAIHDVYKAINDVMYPLTKIVTGSPIKNGMPSDHIEFYRINSEACHSASSTLAQAVVGNAIYFDDETYKIISSLSNEASHANASFLYYISEGIAEGHTTDDILDVIGEKLPELQKTYNDTIVPLKRLLVEEFRLQLGIISPLSQ